MINYDSRGKNLRKIGPIDYLTFLEALDGKYYILAIRLNYYSHYYNDRCFLTTIGVMQP